MGLDYTAATIIGFRVSKANIHHELIVPNCSHGATGVKFCPKCGKPVGTHLEYTAKGEWEVFRYKFIDDDNFVAGIEGLVFEPLPEDFVFQENEDYFWIGYGSTCDRFDDKKIPLPPNTGALNAKISLLLAPFTATGIFELKDENFGIWTTFIGR